MLWLCLVSASAFAAQPAQAIISGGGATAEAGEKALKAFKAVPTFGELLTFAPGFPKVVESKTVSGLKPGFFVVVLGFCGPKEARAPLSVAKSVRASVYARAVQVDELACPTVAWTREGDVTVGNLSGLVIGKPNAAFRVMVMLTDEKGEVVDFKSYTEKDLCDGLIARKPFDLSGVGSTIVMDGYCNFAGCMETDELVLKYSFSEADKRLKEVPESKFTKGACL
jgi:hypothetical protein